MGENIIINIPVLTEERRRDLVKQAKHEAEEAKLVSEITEKMLIPISKKKKKRYC